MQCHLSYYFGFLMIQIIRIGPRAYILWFNELYKLLLNVQSYKSKFRSKNNS